ncbi:hypothetical protein B0H17DRAFT_234435 [Mycena rosella]|uniref:Uncharacterized protein n=1 Tax=Mycena rosella TaxID=1033263 RepID=A0AAD7H1R6_MYCRO|nr:hypothetical protein B0H17DRAFT_234435 [Mycena rosella]
MQRATCPWPADNKFTGPCALDICPHSHCACTGLSYLLAAACNSCINEPQISWTDYSNQNPKIKCDALPHSFTDPLPSGTAAIPIWASVMISETPTPTTFDLEKAKSIATVISANSGVFPSSSTSPSSSESTPSLTATINPPAASPSNQSGSDANPSPTLTPSSPGAPITAASKSTSHAGPIAGGIIGGALFLALVALGIRYSAVRRRRKHIAPSAAYKAAVRAGNTSPTMPYHPVHHESPRNSTDELRPEHPGSWLPSAPASIRSESRFHEQI